MWTFSSRILLLTVPIIFPCYRAIAGPFTMSQPTIIALVSHLSRQPAFSMGPMRKVRQRHSFSVSPLT